MPRLLKDRRFWLGRLRHRRHRRHSRIRPSRLAHLDALRTHRADLAAFVNENHTLAALVFVAAYVLVTVLSLVGAPAYTYGRLPVRSRLWRASLR